MVNEVAPRARGWRNKAIVVVALMAGLCAGWAQAALTEVYRFYHLDAGRHFYTANADERDKVLANYPRFAYEGVAFFAYPTQDPGTIPVYRFYHTGNGSHVYTASEAEKTSILANFPIYSYEGAVFYAEASAAGGAMPLYRLYNTKLGTHFFTTSGTEANSAVATWPWFANEGSTFYVRPGPGQPGNGANIAPNANLSVASTQVSVGDTVKLTASVADPDGTVSKVDYFLGSTKIGTTMSAPHSMNYVATAAGSLMFSAVATDNGGLSGASNSILVTAMAAGGPSVPPPTPSNAAPAVTLTTSSTAVMAGATVILSANAVDTDGSVTKVMFYSGTVLLAKVTNAPFTTTFTPGSVGTYMLSAVATDDDGAQTTSNTVLVTASSAPPGPNTPPTVSLVTSSSNISLGGTALLTASAADADGNVAKVEFYDGGTLLNTDTSAPFAFSYTPTAAGTYVIKAIATDNKGATTTSNSVSVTVVASGGGNSPPISILSASPLTVAPGAVSVLTATTFDLDGLVTKVVFFDGATSLGQVTTSPFRLNFMSNTPGGHALTAVATDDKGASTTSNTVTVTVSGGGGGGGGGTNKPPSVTLAASANTVAIGEVAILTATAADPDGTVSKVVFYSGATLLGQVTTAPFKFDFSSKVAGSFSLTAVATDNLGASTTSSPVLVTVNTNGGGGGGGNKLPTVAITASAATVTVGSTSTLTATAADIDGTIASVAFFNGTTQLSLDTTSPYSYAFTPATAGTYMLTAVATDNDGGKATSNTVTVVATAAAGTGQPTIVLAIAPNTLVAAPTTLTLTGTARSTFAATGATVTRVSFYMNGAKLADVAAPTNTGTPAPLTFSAPISASGTYTFYAQVTDSLGNVTTTLTQTVTAAVPSAVNTTSADVWRLMNQATFGASQAEAASVLSLGISGWINDQLTKPISGYPDTKYNKIQLTTSADCTNNMPGGGNYPADSPQALCARDQLTLAGVQRDFFTNAISGSDQLRQRVAWALSQILVTSANEPDLSYAHVMSRYQNLMFQEAFGNFENLLLKVTYNAAMGNYLDSVNNDRPVGTKVPNENYAREILQLFTIGLDELNVDGTPILDASGKAIQTYSEADILSFARVFTGYTYSNAANSTGQATAKTNTRYYGAPMIPYPTTATVGHDPDAKTLLSGTVLPPGQTAKQDIDAAVRNAFMHPNTGPFIGRQMIQRLVTGNPTPAYVGRVAAAFNNNGSGVRGDMAAVVKAVLLDPEARGGAKTASDFGQLKEPVLMVTNMIRALSGVTDGNGLEGTTANLGQRPYYAPTVFNYFPPDATIPGTMVRGPEFAIHTTQTAVARANLVYQLVYQQNLGPSASIPGASGTRLFLAQFESLADNPAAMVSQINKVLAGGQFPVAKEATIVTAVNAITISATPTATERTARARMAVYLMASSYDYQVQR